MSDIQKGIPFFFPCGLIAAAFEYFECVWLTNILLLLGLQNVFLFLLMVKQLIKNATWEPALRQCGGGWKVCGNI